MNTHRGFTLIELLVVIAIVAIIAAIAVPSYSAQVRKSRRAEAVAVLGDLRLRQESYRANNPTYGALADIGGAPASDFYTFTVTGNNAAGYTVTATAKGAQASDTSCATMSLNQTGAITAGNAECFAK